MGEPLKRKVGPLLVATKGFVLYRIVFVLLVLPWVGIDAFPQNGCALIDTSRSPQVVSFDHIEEGPSVAKWEGGARVWLRFQNNTACTLVLISEMEPGARQLKFVKLPNGRNKIEHVEGPPEIPANGTPVELSYRTQDGPMRKAPMNATSKHYVFSVRLMPGRFILFHVPLKYFKQGLHITMPFNYEWELDQNGFMHGGFRVFHEAYFFNADLPREIIGSK